jgi:hypothetical protein
MEAGLNHMFEKMPFVGESANVNANIAEMSREVSNHRLQPQRDFLERPTGGLVVDPNFKLVASKVYLAGF